MGRPKLDKEKAEQALDALLEEIGRFNEKGENDMVFYSRVLFPFDPEKTPGDEFDENNYGRGYSEYELVDDAVAFPELREKLRSVLKAIIGKFHIRKYFWINDEVQAGQYLSYRLAMTDEADIPLYKEYLSAYDWDHEVDIGEDIGSVVKKWKDNPQVESLKGYCEEEYDDDEYDDDDDEEE